MDPLVTPISPTPLSNQPLSYATLLLLLLSFINPSLLHNAGVVAVVAAAVTPSATIGGGLSGNETDRLSLLSFKDAVFGDPTGALRSWNDSLHYCQWRGVTCGRRHPDRVTALNLTSLSLSGHISPSLANLTFLREIDLRHNQLRGDIPPQLGGLSRLRSLVLHNNSLTGRIPSNLSRCSELRSLILGNNQLVGEIPIVLGSLPKLVHLIVGINQLTGAIPPSLGNLSSNLFKALSLPYNNLIGGIPRELGRLKNLEFFAVGENKLSGTIPPSLYNLSNLWTFAVEGNQLSGTLPSDLGTALPKLRYLGMSGNRFQGSIPTSLSYASSLQVIALTSNMLTGTIPDNLGTLKQLNILIVNTNRLEARVPGDWAFFTSLTNCTRLRVLSLTRNELRGPLPNSVANFSTTLQLLTMGRNQISGRIPLGIGSLTGLTLLGVGGNRLTGNIPPTLGNLNKLVVLELALNRFSGEIPTEPMGNLTQLSQLFLSRNYLSGKIPTSIGRCQHLQTLDISDNSLNASIPEELFTIPTLVILDLSDNYLEGPLPSRMGRLLSFRGLDLSSNRLSGSLPTALGLGDCQSMEELYLYNNSLEGAIPPSFGNLKGIEVMDFSLNNLTGKIPDFLEDLKFLSSLNLSFNNFIGEVPRGGVFANASAISLLENPRVCGGISELRLPACPLHEENGRKGAHSTKVIVVAVVVVGLCILIFVGFISSLRWMRKSKEKKPSASLFESKLQKISYNDLFKATEGFSQDNLIGMGSFGSVYKGVLDDENKVAVKVFNLQNEGASKSFRSECEALRSIRHRNLIKIISVCCSLDFSGQEFKALVYEFLPNGSLETWLHSEQAAETLTLDFAQRLSIVADVASALDYVHNHSHSPIVHCDLKPSNVLLDQNMTAHVGDFGLARFVLNTSSQSIENQSSTIGLKGSIGYIAPEYGVGSPVSTCGDIYSFGILLLEIFTVKRPMADMFKDGLSLQKLVEIALPEKVMDIVDPVLLFPANDVAESPINIVQDNNGGVSSKEIIEDCLVPLMRLGLNCSKEAPRERMTMGVVVKEIQVIQESYLKVQRL